jgi:hypothetical protein
MILENNDKCPICDLEQSPLIHLNNYPLTEIYQKFQENTHCFETYFDQTFNYCEQCNHGFLGRLLPRDFIYQNYNTHTSISIGSTTAINNFSNFILHNSVSTPISIIDIGANDASLLKLFKNKKSRLIGIDPNINSDDPTIELIKDYFEQVDPQNLGIGPKLYLCSHTLEHIFNPNQFLSNLARTSTEEDEFFFQFPSLELLVSDGRFDQVHHQHIQYFSLQSFQKILNRYGFELLNYRYDGDHYGALMCFFKKTAPSIRFKKTHTAISSSDILMSYNVFRASLESTNQRLMLGVRNFECYGASLMLPIIAYYMPNLSMANFILEGNSKKLGLSYVNFDRQIIDEQSFEYTNSNLVVTAISTKMATRQIVKKLISLNVGNIILPFNTI